MKSTRSRSSHVIGKLKNLKDFSFFFPPKFFLFQVLILERFDFRYFYLDFNHLTARLKKLIVTKLSLKIRVHDSVYITCILTAITPEPII